MVFWRCERCWPERLHRLAAQQRGQWPQSAAEGPLLSFTRTKTLTTTTRPTPYHPSCQPPYAPDNHAPFVAAFLDTTCDILNLDLQILKPSTRDLPEPTSTYVTHRIHRNPPP